MFPSLSGGWGVNLGFEYEVGVERKEVAAAVLTLTQTWSHSHCHLPLLLPLLLLMVLPCFRSGRGGYDHSSSGQATQQQWQQLQTNTAAAAAVARLGPKQSYAPCPGLGCGWRQSWRVSRRDRFEAEDQGGLVGDQVPDSTMPHGAVRHRAGTLKGARSSGQAA